jgi:hypothetical protein
MCSSFDRLRARFQILECELLASRRVFCRAQAGDCESRQSTHISDIDAAFEAAGCGSCRVRSLYNRVIGAQCLGVAIDGNAAHSVGDTGSGRRGVNAPTLPFLRVAL